MRVVKKLYFFKPRERDKNLYSESELMFSSLDNNKSYTAPF